MANVTETIKMAGPDRDGNFKVLQTKNCTLVYPGQVYTQRIFNQLVGAARRRPAHRKLEVTAVEAKLSGDEFARFGLQSNGPNSFSEESGGKVRDYLEAD